MILMMLILIHTHLKTFVLKLKKISFHSNSKTGNTKDCSNDCTTGLILHATKVMLKIFQARL